MCERGLKHDTGRGWMELFGWCVEASLLWQYVVAWESLQRQHLHSFRIQRHPSPTWRAKTLLYNVARAELLPAHGQVRMYPLLQLGNRPSYADTNAALSN